MVRLEVDPSPETAPIFKLSKDSESSKCAPKMYRFRVAHSTGSLPERSATKSVSDFESRFWILNAPILATVRLGVESSGSLVVGGNLRSQSSEGTTRPYKSFENLGIGALPGRNRLHFENKNFRKSPKSRDIEEF